MKTSILIFILLTFIIVHLAISQETQALKELQIGSKITPISISKIFPESATLSDLETGYKKGGLIINFWASWCVPCVKEMELLGKLAKKYPDKLTVLSVTHEGPEVTKAFLARHPEINISGLTILNNDKNFVQLFPHRYLPHNVWIDKNGIIESITAGEEINEKNILKFLAGKSLNATIKKDNLDFDYFKPFIPADSLLRFSSNFSSYQSGIGAGCLTPPKNSKLKAKRIFSWNSTILQLYWTAFSSDLRLSDDINPDLVEVISKDSLKIRQPGNINNTTFKTKTDWFEHNAYCYDLSFKKPIAQDSLFGKMKSDLNYFFGYKVNLQEKERMSTIIRFRPGIRYPKSKGGEKIFELTASGIKMQNMTIQEFIFFLNHYFYKLDPILDQTGISYPIDLILENEDPKKGFNFNKGISLMKKRGFIFQKEKHLASVLVIQDFN